jgi:hypothetical protein
VFGRVLVLALVAVPVAVMIRMVSVISIDIEHDEFQRNSLCYSEHLL